MVIDFVKDFLFEYGVYDTLSPLVRRVIANNPGPFTYTGTGTYIIGEKELAVIDPGPLDYDHLSAILNATEKQKITHILITHNHSDHSPLALPLKEKTGAKIYYKKLKTEDTGSEEFEEGYDKKIIGDVKLKDGDVIKNNEWTIEAVHTPGHTSNHICFALKEEQKLFSGDHVMGWSTTVIVPPDGDMNDYIMSLKKLISREEELFLPTHGPVIEKPKKLLQDYITHRLDRERQILEAISKGNCKIPDMVKIIYKDVDPQLHPAAAMSTLAHLNRMINNNEVLVEGKNLDGNYNLV